MRAASWIPSKRHGAWLLGASLSLLAPPSVAEPLPSYLPMPPGCTPGATVFHAYDRLEVGVPPLAGVSTAWQHLEPAGHLWSVTVAAPQGYRLSAWRAALEGAGWQVFTADATVVARHDGAQGDVWLLQTVPWSFRVLAAAPLPAFALPAPGATPEEPAASQPMPYLPPLPGLTLATYAVQDTPEEMTGPLTERPFFAGPPVWHWEYRGSAELSGFEVQQRYAAAFTAAGWTLNVNDRGGVVSAHYAQRGRDLWAKVLGREGALSLRVADVGAQAAAARLRAQLEREGHVALYGIYFDTDRDVLRPDSEATLQQILVLLRQVPSLRLELQGHTDNTGAPPHNQTLSEGRANAVRRWLLEHGIPAARLTAAGYGERQPVTDNRTPEGRARNRRVELRRL